MHAHSVASCQEEEVMLALHGCSSRMFFSGILGCSSRMSALRAVQVADIVNTHKDKLARLIRKRLRRRGVAGPITVVFSPEPAPSGSMREVSHEKDAPSFKRSYYGTVSYMPAVFGMHAAAHVITELSGVGKKHLIRERDSTLPGVPPGTKPKAPGTRRGRKLARQRARRAPQLQATEGAMVLHGEGAAQRHGDNCEASDVHVQGDAAHRQVAEHIPEGLIFHI
jgi:hypothetical protein